MCTRALVFETGSGRQIGGWVSVTATFVALPFIFYGFKQTGSTNRPGVPGSLIYSIADGSGSLNLETGCVVVNICLCLYLYI